MKTLLLAAVLLLLVPDAEYGLTDEAPIPIEVVTSAHSSSDRMVHLLREKMRASKTFKLVSSSTIPRFRVYVEVMPVNSMETYLAMTRVSTFVTTNSAELYLTSSMATFGSDKYGDAVDGVLGESEKAAESVIGWANLQSNTKAVRP